MSEVVLVALITGGFTLAAGIITPGIQAWLQRGRDRRADRRRQADAVQKGVTRLNDAKTRFISDVGGMPKPPIVHDVSTGKSYVSNRGDLRGGVEVLRRRQHDHCQRAFNTFAGEVKSAFIDMSFGISDPVVRESFQTTWEHWNAVLDELNPAAYEELNGYEGAVDRLSYAELDGGLADFAFDSQKRLIAEKKKDRNDRRRG